MTLKCRRMVQRENTLSDCGQVLRPSALYLLARGLEVERFRFSAWIGGASGQDRKPRPPSCAHESKGGACREFLFLPWAMFFCCWGLPVNHAARKE